MPMSGAADLHSHERAQRARRKVSPVDSTGSTNFTRTPQVVAVLFYAGSCRTCRAFDPRFESLARKAEFKDVEFVKIGNFKVARRWSDTSNTSLRTLRTFTSVG